MSTPDISTAKDPDLRGSFVALLRASGLAQQAAAQAGTDLVVVQDGQIMLIEVKAPVRPAKTEDSESHD